jgi:Flp pilus assembly protein TadB
MMAIALRFFYVDWVGDAPMNSVLTSTLMLTGLLGVGLTFFIRASTKDRTEVTQLTLTAAPDDLQTRMVGYFQSRAYQLVEDASSEQLSGQSSDQSSDQWIRLKGWVRPSLFLAIFLGTLAAVGLLCFVLVLAILFPSIGWWWLGLVLLAPLASLFYWRRAAREEAIAFKVAPPSTAQAASPKAASLLTVQAHRDEIIQLEAALKPLLVD